MPESDDIPLSRDSSSASEASKLIFGDELYLHHTDASSTPLINVKLTGTDNYNVWSHAMTLALHSKNKIGFIDGKCKKPTDKTLVNQWEIEESHRGSSSVAKNKHHASAFVARSYNNNETNKGHNNDNNNRNNGRNPNLICSNPNCGLTEHTVDKCYKIVGYPDHIKKKWANQKSSNSFSSNNASVEVPTSTASSP
ncbi:ribonuclease H-like domain-containing protein [Tanacetum coccineum]